ncbi:hypothetical protein A4X13_0g3851, partial [Tilletia indica]
SALPCWKVAAPSTLLHADQLATPCYCPVLGPDTVTQRCHFSSRPPAIEDDDDNNHAQRFPAASGYMSFSNSPSRPATLSSHHHPSSRQLQTVSTAASSSPGTTTVSAAAAETVDIPLDEPASQTQPARQYYNYYQHQKQQQQQQDQIQPPPSHRPTHQQQSPFIQQHLPTQQSQSNHPYQVQHHSSTHSRSPSLIPPSSSPRHIPPTFLPLHHSHNPHSPSPVLHALSSTLSTAFNSLNQLTQAGSTAIAAAGGGAGSGPGPASGGGVVSVDSLRSNFTHDAVPDHIDRGFVPGSLASPLRGQVQHSLSANSAAPPGVTAQQSLPATISWTSWTVRPAAHRSHQGSTESGDDGDNTYSLKHPARAPALIVGYSSGALQVYVFESSAAAKHQSAALDELCFLPRVPALSSAQPAPASTDDKQRPQTRRRSSAVDHASAVHGAVFLSADMLLVLTECSTSAAGGTRAINLIALSLPDSSSVVSDPTHKQNVPKAVASYKVRDLGPHEAVVSAQLRASGTAFLAVSLTITKLDNPLAPFNSEIHALRIASTTSSALTPPVIHHACAPLTDLPPGVRPTLDLCGRVLVYAACMPSINARDRAAGGNFIAAAGAFGSHSAAGGAAGGLRGSEGDLSSEAGLGTPGSGAGGATAAMMNLGHRAAAAGLSSMSALTAAAAARFSPSSIGSGTGNPSPTGMEGGMSGLHGQYSQQQQLQQQPGWEQHASAAASAISIGAGAGVDAARRVGSGVLSGVRGLSGYLGAASTHRTHASISNSSSPPYVPSQLSRSAPSSQGGLAGAGRLGMSGFTSATSIDRAPSAYAAASAQQPRRFSSGIQHRNSISQRSGGPRLGGGNLGSAGNGPHVEEAVQSPTDSPLLQPSSHEEILPASQSPGLVGAAPSFGAPASSSPHAQGQDAASFAGSSVGSKRFSGHSLASAAQGYAQSGVHAFSTSVGATAQPSSFSHLQSQGALSRANLVLGPVWVRVVDLSSVSSSPDDLPESLSRPRTLALFRPPNSSLGLLSQVGLGWSAGTNAAAAAAAASNSGTGGAALLSSSSPRSPTPIGGPEYSSSFSSSMAGAGGPFSPTSAFGALPTVAPSLAPNPVALLSLSPDGSSLLTADALGQVFHVWEMMPCPAPIRSQDVGASASSVGPGSVDSKARRGRASSASYGGPGPGLTGLEEESLPPSVWHRYKLSRGLTSAQVVAATWSADAQFVFVQSQKGTVHAYPVNPHGGAPDVGKHLQHPGASASDGNKGIGLGTLSVEVKPIARLRPVEVPTQQPLTMSTTTETGTLTPTTMPGALGRRVPVPTTAAASLMLLNPKMCAEPPSLIPSDLGARKLQLLVYHPGRDMVLLHSFACVASATADVVDINATGTNGGTSSDRSGSLIAGLPRSVSAPVAAVATGAAAAASSGLTRMMSRTGNSWGSSAAGGGGGRGGDSSGGVAGLGQQSRSAGRIFFGVSGGGSNGGHAHGLMGDSVAFAAWCGLARVVLEEEMLEVDETALDLNDLELGDDEEIGLGDDAEALEKRALLRDRHMRHGSSPLARPAVQVAASEVSSPSGSDEESGTRAKTTDTTPISKTRPLPQAQTRLQVAETGSAVSQSSSADLTSSASPKVGEGKKTTVTTNSPAQGGKKKRKGSTKAAGSSVDAAIPVLELPPSKTSEVTPKTVVPPVTQVELKEEEKQVGQVRSSLPPFRMPSWVTQIEVETYSRAPRVLPSTIWLSHQFDFCEPKAGKTALSSSLHALYKHKTSKLEVREEVQVDAPMADGDTSFDQGLISAIEARVFDGSSLGPRLGGNGSFSADSHGSAATWKIPMFPQGQRARHPAWHERVIAAGGVPIRNVAGGLGHGLGRAGREIGRSVEGAVSARRKRLSSASSGANDVAGFEAFDFEDDIGEGQGMGGQGLEGASAFLEVRAAKEAAGLSVEDLPATEIDSDDEQTWKDARKANQGLDDEFEEGWDGFAAEGCAPPQSAGSAASRRGTGYMMGLLEEDGGVGRPASRAAAVAVPATPVPALKLGRQSLALAASSGGGVKSAVQTPTPPLASSNSTKSTPTSSSKVGRASSTMPGSLPLPATASARSSSTSTSSATTSSRRKADATGTPSGTSSFDLLYNR